MTEEPKLKCKWCSWNCAPWITSRKGKRRFGWYRLADHIRDKHPDHESEAVALMEDQVGQWGDS